MEQIELLYNKGVFAINKPNRLSKEKTVIVLGVARGGTSMIAGTLHHLGIAMGENLSAVYEDIALSTAIEQNQTKDIASIITQRNTTFPIWGWKRPSAIQHIQAWHGKFRNPYYVVVFRDLFSIANRNRISMLSDVVSNMQDANRQFESMLDFVAALKEPTLLVSYEKAMADPLHFVQMLCNFIDINAETATHTAVEFIKPNPEHYLKASRITSARGIVDAVQTNRISGWAMYPQAPDQSAKILVEINNNREFVVIANHFRQDLLDTHIHPTGKCGFILVLSDKDALHPGDTVSVRVAGDINTLANGMTTVLAKDNER